MRLQLGNGRFEGHRVVSAESLAATLIPRVGMSDKVSYAMGWVSQRTPNGTIIWHDGGTSAFGAYVGFLPDKHVGVIVLTNEANVGLPDALGLWSLDRLLGNPKIDHVANALKSATAKFEASAKLFAKPANPRPFPPVAPLAGSFVNSGFGKAVVPPDGEALTMEFQATGARLKLEPWDGDIFTARLMALGRFAAVAEDLGPLPSGFVQFQMDKEGKLNTLRLSFDDGQAYDFKRE